LVLPRHLDSGKRQKEPLREKNSKSARTTVEMSHPKPHSSIDDVSRNSDEEAGYRDDAETPLRPELAKIIAQHVAAHLQALMFLTIRLASLQSEQESPIEEIKSDTVDVDGGDNSSRGQDLGKISDIDVEEATEMDTVEDSSLHKDGDIDLDDDLPLEDTIPVLEDYVNWNGVPRCDEPPMEEDKFLQEVIKSGTYQSHLVKVSFLSWEALTLFSLQCLEPVSISGCYGHDIMMVWPSAPTSTSTGWPMTCI
jgi:hypothetical protein